jgi:hypothetical protein
VLDGVGIWLVKCWSYWVMAMLAMDDAVSLARYAGMYKGMQSCGAAAAWALGALAVRPSTQVQPSRTRYS